MEQTEREGLTPPKKRRRMHKGFRIRLYPTKAQERKLWQTVHAVRNTWNWALALQMGRFANGERPMPTYDLAKELAKRRKEPELAWTLETAKNSSKLVLFDLEEAYRRFHVVQKQGERFTKKTIERAKRRGRKLTPYDLKGHPKFKSRHLARPAFPMPADNVRFKDGRATVLKVGRVKYRTDADIRFGARVYNPRVTYERGKWTMTFSMDVEMEKPALREECVGIDLGVKNLATVSCGDLVVAVPNVNKSAKVRWLEKRLRRQQRMASRRQKGSKNQAKAYAKVADTYSRIRGIRRDHVHKATRMVVDMLPMAIGIEDLNVSGMLKNRHLAKSIAGGCLREFRRQLEYKAEWSGIEVVTADRFWPSSKRCSGCGHVHRDLRLGDRTFKCPRCGTSMDRDANAAKNLERLASERASANGSTAPSRSTGGACGASHQTGVAKAEPGVMKQESGIGQV